MFALKVGAIHVNAHILDGDVVILDDRKKHEMATSWRP